MSTKTYTADQMHTLTYGTKGTLTGVPTTGTPTHRVTFVGTRGGYPMFLGNVADPIFVPVDSDATFTPEA